MVTKAQLAKWGNSLAVRIPKHLADEAKLREGDRLVLEVEGPGSVAIKAVRPPKTLNQLISQITPENIHKAQDWPEPVGAEIW